MSPSLALTFVALTRADPHSSHPSSLSQGLSAGLLRQATYTTARLGIHAKIVDFLKEQNKGAPPLVQKAGAGLAAGGLGAMFGSPADLSLIRMQADGTLPPRSAETTPA